MFGSKLAYSTKKIYVLAICLCSFFIVPAQDVIEEISIEKIEQIDTFKTLLREYILPDTAEDVTTTFEIRPDEWPEGPTQHLTQLGHIKKASLILKNGFTSNVFILHPKISNHLQIPIIYHGGHGGAFWEDRYLNNSGRPYSISVLNFFLGKGFDVIVIDMPLCGENPAPVIAYEDDNPYIIYSHDDIFQLKDPFYYFFEPVKKTIDWLETSYGYKKFVMMGLSGGGWTTTIYSAMDKRISQSYAVAGSIPLPLRTHPSDIGDLEQNFSEFYNEFNYSTLYALAASGKDKIHYQVLNLDDNCCFDFNGNEYWVPVVQQKLEELGNAGNFKFYHDPYATIHKISSAAVDTFYHYITNDLLYKNIPFKVKLSNSNISTYICKDDALELSATLNEGDLVQWFKDTIAIANETTTSIQVNNNGSYYARILNISGISIYSDTITITRIDLPRPYITRDNSILISSSSTGNQWYRNGVPVTGATNNRLIPGIPGSYTVVASKEHCFSMPSASYEFGILVYPNPASTEINIRLNPALGKITLELYDITGRLVLKDYMTGNKKINAGNLLKKGVYVLKLKNNTDLIGVEKIFIE